MDSHWNTYVMAGNYIKSSLFTWTENTRITKEGLISLYTIDIISRIVFSELFRIVKDDIYDSYIHNFLLLKIFLFDDALYEKDNIIIDTKHVMF